MGVTPQYVHQYTSSPKNAGLGVVTRFAEALDLDPINLLNTEPLRFLSSADKVGRYYCDEQPRTTDEHPPNDPPVVPCSYEPKESLYRIFDELNTLMEAASEESPDFSYQLSETAEAILIQINDVSRFIDSVSRQPVAT